MLHLCLSGVVTGSFCKSNYSSESEPFIHIFVHFYEAKNLESSTYIKVSKLSFHAKTIKKL